jgi:hypothetical protein
MVKDMLPISLIQFTLPQRIQFHYLYFKVEGQADIEVGKFYSCNPLGS